MSSRVDFVRKEPGAERIVASVDFVEPNLNLLAHAQTLELEIGSRCGGHGICGGDRVKVLGREVALSPITDAEHRHLTKEEIVEGYRLACQCFPNDPVVSLRVEILPD